MQQDLTVGLEQLTTAYTGHRYPTLNERRQWLLTLKRLLVEKQDEIAAAINEDFGRRSLDETRILEILPVISAIRFNLRHLRRWMKPARRSSGLLFFPGQSQVLYQPLGVIGVVAPWNYPLMLSAGPMVSAMAAGNRMMIKMSEYTPNFGRLFAELCQQYFGNDLVQVVNGDSQVAQAFSSLPFDHLLFTGSTNIGRAVMKAAAENLTPVTLELGGKSPVVVAPDYDIREAARRLLWPKIMSAGQTCVAPDYVLCPEGKVGQLVDELKALYSQQLPDAATNTDCTYVISDRQRTRLDQLLAEATSLGANVIKTQEYLADARHRPLILVTGVTSEMRIMQEEIFGPLLPIVAYRDLQQAVDMVNSAPRPLALYIFSNDVTVQRQVMEQTHSGGAMVNDAAIHVGVDSIPFGGVGPSGMGHYHGWEGFQQFSNAKGIHRRGRIHLTRLFNPPYDRWLVKLMQKIFIR
ncbi:coniferyl aldehyde dehydrogenase [Gynuella sp.]|uniref:coniferyl aldehyde dehydrogenase n=1 Tax=Gynuella sp. TaxID=2969146 RepID=UPI003D0BB0CF